MNSGYKETGIEIPEPSSRDVRRVVGITLGAQPGNTGRAALVLVDKPMPAEATLTVWERSQYRVVT